MLSYCLKCRKNTEIKNPKVVQTKNGRLVLLSKCSVCNSEKLKFLKEQEARGLLSGLAIRAPLSQIRVLGPLLFQKHKMNEIIDIFLLAEDKFMPEMHLKQPGCLHIVLVDRSLKIKKE